MDVLQKAFPDLISELRRLRQSDPILDEVCGDFELLNRDLARLASQTTANRENLRSDIQESLVSLTSEIRQRVSDVSTRPGGGEFDKS